MKITTSSTEKVLVTKSPAKGTRGKPRACGRRMAADFPPCPQPRGAGVLRQIHLARWHRPQQQLPQLLDLLPEALQRGPDGHIDLGEHRDCHWPALSDLHDISYCFMIIHLTFTALVWRAPLQPERACSEPEVTPGCLQNNGMVSQTQF